MGTEGNGSPEPTLARTREQSEAAPAGASGFFAALEQAIWFRPAAFLVPALVAAAMLAPGLSPRSYPTDAALIGTPATENIKAPRDLQVVDKQTTDRLRAEAVERTPRVYELDPEVGAGIAARVRDAFATVENQRQALFLARPDLARSDRMSRSARARLEAELLALYENVRPRVGELIGSPLTDAEHAVLVAHGYRTELGEALAATIARVQEEPIVSERALMQGERGRGITVHRVRDERTDARHIKDLEEVLDLARLPKRLNDALSQAAPQVSESERVALVELLRRLAAPNLTPNAAATDFERDQSRDSVNDVFITLKKGEMVLRDGDRISGRHLMILTAMSESADSAATFLVTLGGGILVLILLLVGFGIGGGRDWKMTVGARDTLFLAALFILTLLAGRGWLALSIDMQQALFPSLPVEAFLFAGPVAAGAIITRLVLREEIAILFAVVGSVVLGVMVGEPGFLAYALIGSVLGGTLIKTMSKRSDLLRAGLWVSAGQSAVAVALLLFQAETHALAYVVSLGAAFVSGLLAAIVALAMTSVVEAAFGYTTDLKLLELANLNHPALKELIVQAPGSYHHSIIVGSLVEAAAEAVGANALLARVQAYYHDLGKGCNPAYFIENQRGNNPHTKLKPSMSAMIIRRHVTDGIDIAKRYGLGEQILAAIVEHHGTTLIHYFYEKAKENEEEGSTVAENDYRYPGQKPQTRETALVMLADSVEAASRSLADPTPARLQGLVNRIVNLKFTDGQLDECDLTLKDMHTIARSFTRILGSIYHDRPEYPGLLTDITGGKKASAQDDSKPAAKKNGKKTAAADEAKPAAKKNGKKAAAADEAKPAANKNGKGDAAANGTSEAEDAAEEKGPENIRRLGINGR